MLPRRPLSAATARPPGPLRRVLLLLTFLAPCLCPPGAPGQTALPTAAAAAVLAAAPATLPPAYQVSPQLVLPTNNYTEGIVFDAEDNFYFSQTRPGTVTRVTPSGEVSLWAKVPGANGHKILADGTHLVCADRAVAVLAPDGRLLGSIRECEGQGFIYPNDLIVDAQGGWYLTDSGDRDPADDGTLSYGDAEGHLKRVDQGLAFANGIALSPDGRRLYVDEGNLNANHVLVYDVEAPGQLARKRVFAALPTAGDGQIDNKPDGMCVDAAGNLYVSHWGMGQVEVLSPEGRLLRSYRTGHLTQSNLAFGGGDRTHLFLTGGDQLESGVGSITRLDLGVPGLDIRPRPRPAR